jgi:3-oxoacyl-[acyl-carrier protein] reductase
MTRHGGIDALVNNAGVHVGEPFVLADDDDALREMFEVNVVAPRAWVRGVFGVHARAGRLRRNVTSVAGVRGEKGIGGYGVSKAALAHLTAQLALELGPSVRVNAVAPGFTFTNGTPPRARGTRTGLLWHRSRR